MNDNNNYQLNGHYTKSKTKSSSFWEDNEYIKQYEERFGINSVQLDNTPTVQTQPKSFWEDNEYLNKYSDNYGINSKQSDTEPRWSINLEDNPEVFESIKNAEEEGMRPKIKMDDFVPVPTPAERPDYGVGPVPDDELPAPGWSAGGTEDSQPPSTPSPAPETPSPSQPSTGGDSSAALIEGSAPVSQQVAPEHTYLADNGVSISGIESGEYSTIVHGHHPVTGKPNQVENNSNITIANKDGTASHYTISMPEEGNGRIDENTSFCINEGGSGGFSTDNLRVQEEAGDNGNENTIFINTDGGSESEYIDRSSDMIDEIAAQTNADRTNRVYMGHSASGKTVTQSAYNYLEKEHKEGRETKTMVVLNDSAGVVPGATDGQVINDKMDTNNFKDSYVVTVSSSSNPFGSNSGRMNAYDDNLRTMSNSGARVLMVGGNAVNQPSDHVEFCNLSGAMGLYDQHSANFTQVTEQTSTMYIGGQKTTVVQCVMPNGSFVYAVPDANGKIDYNSYVDSSGRTVTVNPGDVKPCYTMDTNAGVFDNITFSRIDENGNAVYMTAQEAQDYNDSSVGRMDLFNHGFLHDNNGTYELGSGTERVEITDDALETFAMEFERSGLSYDAFIEKNKDRIIYDKDGKIIGMKDEPKSPRTGQDIDDLNLANIGSAINRLGDSLSSVQSHMNSLSNIKGLGSSQASLSKFCSGSPAFPSGVSTGAFASACDCVSKFASNLQTAYDKSVGFYNAVAEAQNQAPGFFQSNTFASGAQSASSAGNFAQDMQ